MTDAHAHLDACDEPVDTLVERAREAGVTRIVTIGTGIESSRAALEAAERARRRVRGARHPSARAPPSLRPDGSTSSASCFDHPKAVAVGETGLDTVRGFATPTQQRRLFDAQLELADELQLPVVVHNREADDEAAAALAPFAGTVVLHCFSSPALVAARRRPRLLRVVRRQCDLPEGERSA